MKLLNIDEKKEMIDALVTMSDSRIISYSEPIPEILKVMRKYCAVHTHTHTCTVIQPRGNLLLPINVCFWTVGGNQRNWKKPIQSQGEHAKLHKNFNLNLACI